MPASYLLVINYISGEKNMENNEFRKPLIKSACIIVGVFVLFALISSSDGHGSGSGILAIFSGIGNLLLFVIGLTFSLGFSIAVLIAIFLGAVSMESPATASQMYADLKKNFALNAKNLSEYFSCSNSTGGCGISVEEYDQMRNEITQLSEANADLHTKIATLTDDNSVLDTNVNDIISGSSMLKDRLTALSENVGNLNDSEQKVNEILSTLTAQIDSVPTSEFKEQISKLELLQLETSSRIDKLTEQLDDFTANSGQATPPSNGIFSFIEDKEDQTLFVMSGEDAVSKGMTYAQIDEFLTENLSSELDAIIKGHPSLTKKYIRSVRND